MGEREREVKTRKTGLGVKSKEERGRGRERKSGRTDGDEERQESSGKINFFSLLLPLSSLLSTSFLLLISLSFELSQHENRCYCGSDSGSRS